MAGLPQYAAGKLSHIGRFLALKRENVRGIPPV